MSLGGLKGYGGRWSGRGDRAHDKLHISQKQDVIARSKATKQSRCFSWAYEIAAHPSGARNDSFICASCHAPGAIMPNPKGIQTLRINKVLLMAQAPPTVSEAVRILSGGCARNLAASSPPFSRLVAPLRTSKSVDESTRDLIVLAYPSKILTASQSNIFQLQNQTVNETGCTTICTKAGFPGVCCLTAERAEKAQRTQRKAVLRVLCG